MEQVFPMSMNDAIDRVAEHEQQNDYNIVMYYCSRWAYNLLKLGENQNELSPERICELSQEVVRRERLPSPILTADRIDAILSDYPYKLPVELYDLYQRGNGVLPIGLGDKDWDCYYNYSFFPDPEICLFPLESAMSFYHLLNSYDRYRAKLGPNIFPLISAEVGIWAIAGNETQQPTSPVFHFHEEDLSVESFKLRTVWNSMTEMIFNRFIEDRQSNL